MKVDKILAKRSRYYDEQRDPAAIDRYDTTRFARLGHEVPLIQIFHNLNQKHQFL